MTLKAQLQHLDKWQLAALIILALGGLAASFWFLLANPPHSVDYRLFYYPASHAWLSGDSQLYDEASLGFFQAPWTLWALLPFTLAPYEIGQAMLWIVSLGIILFVTLLFAPPDYRAVLVVGMAVFNMHTQDLLHRGQIDAFGVLGIALGWVAIRQKRPVFLPRSWLMAMSYMLLIVKPPNTIPVALFFLGISWRRWSKREIVISLTPAIVMGLLSFVVFPNWPARWIENYDRMVPIRTWLTTIWHIQNLLELPALLPWLISALTLGTLYWAWRKVAQNTNTTNHDKTLAWFMLVLTATFIVTPYSLSYHFIPLITIVMPYLAHWRMRVTAGLYLLTFLPLLRVWVTIWNSWIDIFFVVAIFGATVFYVTRSPQRAETQDTEATTRPQNQPELENRASNTPESF